MACPFLQLGIGLVKLRERNGKFCDMFVDIVTECSLGSRWCFECAWEVGNKVGGIYTVIRSKAGVSTNELGDQGRTLLGKAMFDRIGNYIHI